VAATAATVAAIATLAACGDSTAPIPSGLTDAEIAADVAALSGSAVAADVGTFHDDEAVAGIGAAGAGCSYDATSQTHVCTVTTENGLQVTRTYQFRDAADAPMQSYDAANTASVHFTRSVVGTVTTTTATGATWTGATHRDETRTVTGLLGDETQRVWNGTGTSHDTTSYTATAGTRRYAGSVTQTVHDVVMTLPRSANPYPTSGTLTRAVEFTVSANSGSGSTGASRSVARTVTVTFNGTALVPLQTNDLSCTLNLDTGRVSGCTKQTA
jgi:hypothetical protein